MAATEGDGVLAALMRAAMALPIAAVPVKAGAAEVGEMGFTVLGYKERGLIKVTEPVVWAHARIAEVWEVQGSVGLDIVSGASPEYVTNISGAPVQVLSGASVTDRRRLADLKVTRHFGDLAIGLSGSYSSEQDYDSRAFGVEARQDFNERNTTLAVGYGHALDHIGSRLDPTLDEPRTTNEYLLGVTQVLSRVDLIQSTVTVARGHGWYSDPYKQTRTFYDVGAPALYFDTRPGSRSTLAWLTRYRHHVPDADGTLQADYRYYRDDWGVRSHTLEVGWQQSLNETWSLRPALRYYTQSAARFYDVLVPQPAPAELSSDPRLAAFGGLTPTLRAIMRLDSGLVLEGTVGYIHNSRSLHAGGGGSPLYSNLDAWYGIVSVSHPF